MPNFGPRRSCLVAFIGPLLAHPGTGPADSPARPECAIALSGQQTVPIRVLLSDRAGRILVTLNSVRLSALAPKS